MLTWDHEVAQFEMQYAKKVNQDAQILALMSIKPETVSGESGCSEEDHSICTRTFAQLLG